MWDWQTSTKFIYPITAYIFSRFSFDIDSYSWFLIFSNTLVPKFFAYTIA